jgi:formylglycine-generating enzyme required for sulfatase activity
LRKPGIKQSGNHPVIHISFSDVAAYKEWAGVEIPYETEWLYACRAGKETTFYWGDKFDYDFIWCRENFITGTVKPILLKCIKTPFQPNNRDDDRGFRCIKRIKN